MPIIPFYGATDRAMFEIERRAMDRPGAVITALDRLLPDGLILDIGAGNGFTASRLLAERRRLVALEPAAGMIDPAVRLPWIQGDAAHLPFAENSFDGAYATWAYFFSRNWDPSPGIAEARRVVRPGGVLAIADNLGGDEFTAMAGGDISADPGYWESHGFDCTTVDTAFEFETMDDARRLLALYFGERGAAEARLRLRYRVGIFHTVLD